MEYISTEDTKRRLNGTICMWDGEPVLVTVLNTFPANSVQVSVLGQKKAEMQSINVMDPRFSITPPELGYMNFNGKAFYIQRNPARLQQQGLTINLLGGDDVNWLINNEGGNWATSSAMADMLRNRYPTYERALAHVIKGMPLEVSMAFDRHLCLKVVYERVIGLFYRGRMVGTCTPDKPVFNLVIDGHEAKFITRILERKKVPYAS